MFNMNMFLGCGSVKNLNHTHSYTPKKYNAQACE